MNDMYIYEYVLKIFDNGIKNESILAKAYALSESDIDKQKSLYVKFCVEIVSKQFIINNLNIDLLSKEEILSYLDKYNFSDNILDLNDDWILKLKLWAVENNIDDILNNIDDLAKLEELAIRNVDLSIFPKEIENLKFLKGLILRNNNLTEIPKEVFRILSLETLLIMENDIPTIHENISYLKNLISIHIWNCNLVTISESIGSLQKLKELYFEKNNIKVLPDSIGLLRNLNRLDLSDNSLELLPESFGELKKCDTTVLLQDNQLKRLPKSIVTYNSYAYDDYRDEYDSCRPDTENHFSNFNIRNNPDLELTFEQNNWLDGELSWENSNVRVDSEVVDKAIIDWEQMVICFIKEYDILEEIPRNREELLNITELNLSSLTIEDIPIELYYMKNLQKLNLENLAIYRFKDGIDKLENLEELTLGNTCGQWLLPKGLKKLKKLKKLHLTHSSTLKVDEIERMFLKSFNIYL